MSVKALFTVLLGLTTLNALSQTSYDEIAANPDKAGGIYLAYPVTSPVEVTAPPKGYRPFYISHYGRHGSRYLLGDNDYLNMSAQLHRADSAGVLTPTGVSLMNRIDSVCIEGNGRGGELTPLGYRQHRGIARRMIGAYPEVFAGTPRVYARSTPAMRCAHSMFAFCEGLRESVPSLDITLESSRRNLGYLSHSSEIARQFKGHVETSRKFEQECTQPDRLMSLLFNDDAYVYRNVNPHDFMWSLYWITVDLQDMETPVRLYDILTARELFDMWRSFNYRFYSTTSNNPMNHGMMLDNAKPLLTNIIECADRAITEGYNGADLRFGHDGNLIPLTGLMRIDGCYAAESDPARLHEVYADFKISPMGGNLQLIFFKDKRNDVIVKFLLNEREVSVPVPTDMAPFYRWDDVKTFYRGIIDTPDYGGA